MPRRSGRLGGGGWLATRHTPHATRHRCTECSTVGGLALWRRLPLGSEGKERGYLISFTAPGPIAAGATYRFPVVNGERPFKMSTQFEGGLTWVGAALPMYVYITDRFSLTAGPSGRAAYGLVWNEQNGPNFLFRAPVGMSLDGRLLGLHLNAGLFHESGPDSTDDGGGPLGLEVEPTRYFVSGDLSVALGSR